MFFRVSIVVFCALFSAITLADGSADSAIKDAFDVDASANRTFELYASDKTVQARYDRDSEVVKVDNGRYHAAFLFNENRDLLFTSGLNIDAQPDFLPGVTFSVGGKGYAALLARENSDVVGLGFGLEAGYVLPLKRFPLQIDLGVYYAPDILTFGQSDRIIDWQARVGVALTDKMEVFVGHRYLQFDTRPGEEKLDNKVHIGLRWLLQDK